MLPTYLYRVIARAAVPPVAISRYNLTASMLRVRGADPSPPLRGGFSRGGQKSTPGKNLPGVLVYIIYSP